MNQFMEQAIALAALNEEGGPFAALVVKDGAVIAAGVNRVTRDNDPTAHAEIVAIREACRALGSFQLDGCEIYASCEPCPMCLGAIYWARPARIYYAASREDAEDAGFDDAFLYREMAVPPEDRALPTVRMGRKAGLLPFRRWAARPNKIRY